MKAASIAIGLTIVVACIKSLISASQNVSVLFGGTVLSSKEARAVENFEELSNSMISLVSNYTGTSVLNKRDAGAVLAMPDESKEEIMVSTLSTAAEDGATTNSTTAINTPSLQFAGPNEVEWVLPKADQQHLEGAIPNSILPSPQSSLPFNMNILTKAEAPRLSATARRQAEALASSVVRQTTIVEKESPTTIFPVAHATQEISSTAVGETHHFSAASARKQAADLTSSIDEQNTAIEKNNSITIISAARSLPEAAVTTNTTTKPAAARKRASSSVGQENMMARKSSSKATNHVAHLSTEMSATKLKTRLAAVAREKETQLSSVKQQNITIGNSTLPVIQSPAETSSEKFETSRLSAAARKKKAEVLAPTVEEQNTTFEKENLNIILLVAHSTPPKTALLTNSSTKVLETPRLSAAARKKKAAVLASSVEEQQTTAIEKEGTHTILPTSHSSAEVSLTKLKTRIAAAAREKEALASSVEQRNTRIEKNSPNSNSYSLPEMKSTTSETPRLSAAARKKKAEALVSSIDQQRTTIGKNIPNAKLPNVQSLSKPTLPMKSSTKAESPRLSAAARKKAAEALTSTVEQAGTTAGKSNSKSTLAVARSAAETLMMANNSTKVESTHLSAAARKETAALAPPVQQQKNAIGKNKSYANLPSAHSTPEISLTKLKTRIAAAAREKEGLASVATATRKNIPNVISPVTYSQALSKAIENQTIGGVQNKTSPTFRFVSKEKIDHSDRVYSCQPERQQCNKKGFHCQIVRLKLHKRLQKLTDFSTELDLGSEKLLVLGDSVAAQMFFMLFRASAASHQNDFTEIETGTRPSGRRSLAYAIAGDGKLALWRITAMLRWQNEGKPPPNAAGGGWSLSKTKEFLSVVPTNKTEPVRAFDVLMYRIPHVWLTLDEVTSSRIIESLKTASEVFGVKKVILLTLPFNNNVLQNMTEIWVNKNAGIRRLVADVQAKKMAISGIDKIVMMDLAELTNQFIQTNAEILGSFNDTDPKRMAYLDERLPHQNANAKPSVAHICSSPMFTRQRKRTCFRNAITPDGVHLCGNTYGGRFTAASACLLQCLNQQDDFLKRCQENCNANYMTLDPIII